MAYITKNEIFNQFDNSEKNGIVTDEELLQRGVIYDFKRRMEENLRGISESLTKTEKTGLQTYSEDRISIPRGTSLVEESRIQKIKDINIIGKNISSDEDAAALLSLFRDPRIEISNIILTSENGDILAHRAYTGGVPGVTVPFPIDILKYLEKEIKAFNPKNAWIGHNHPSGNSEPSDEDLNSAKLAYNLLKKLDINFAGSIVLGNQSYAAINSYGQFYQKELNPEQKIFYPDLLKQNIQTQALLYAEFKELLTQENDINIIAVLNGDNKLVSWNYIDNEKEIEPIFNYLRVSGGDSVIIMSNNENNYNYYKSLSKSNIDSERDIFLDIVNIDKKTGEIQHSFYNKINNWSEKIALNSPVLHLINNNVLQQ